MQKKLWRTIFMVLLVFGGLAIVFVGRMLDSKVSWWLELALIIFGFSLIGLARRLE